MCFSTVRGDKNIAAAISRLPCPRAASRSTSASRSVTPSARSSPGRRCPSPRCRGTGTPARLSSPRQAAATWLSPRLAK